jgi:3-oxoacyl-[acyl-carrier protein] reductase
MSVSAGVIGTSSRTFGARASHAAIHETHRRQPLAGKSALVTGGSRGIGAAIVRRLAGDGASVAFTYAASEQQAKSLVAGVRATGGVALAVRADSADANALNSAVDQAAETFGRLDILVNNAGVLFRGLLDEFSLDDFDRMVAINIRAVFVAVKAAVPHLQEGGRIITDMNSNADVNATLRTLMAIGRIGKDVEIASLVAYLASPEASFITGAAITIDGGYLA